MIVGSKEKKPDRENEYYNNHVHAMCKVARLKECLALKVQLSWKRLQVYNKLVLDKIALTPSSRVTFWPLLWHFPPSESAEKKVNVTLVNLHAIATINPHNIIIAFESSVVASGWPYGTVLKKEALPTRNVCVTTTVVYSMPPCLRGKGTSNRIFNLSWAQLYIPFALLILFQGQ